MKSLKRLLFLTDTRIPSGRASAIHVRKLLPALGELCEEAELLSNEGDDTTWPGFHENVKHKTIRLPSLKGGLYWMLWLFGKAIRKSRAEAIYSRFVLVSLLRQKKPYVIELHDDAWNKGFLFRKAITKAVTHKQCLGFTAITHAIKSDLLSAYPGIQKRVEVIEDAAAPAPPEYHPAIHERDCLNAVYVGSFHQGKGLEVVLQLAKKASQHRFTVIGGSPDQINQLSGEKTANLTFTGFVDHDQIWKHMLDADVCLLPNQPNVKTGKKSNIGRYTSPLKMFEYMSYAKPMIASDLPVLKEVLDDQIAIFAGHEDVSDWEKALDRLTDPLIREKIGKQAYQRFNEKYTWEKRAERILSFVNEELERA